MFSHKLKLACEFRDIGATVDYFYDKEPKMRKQLDFVLENGIEKMVIIGEDKIKNGTIKLKYINEKKEVVMNRAELDFFIIYILK